MTDQELSHRWVACLTAIFDRHPATCGLLIDAVPEFEELRLVVHLVLPAAAVKAFEQPRRAALLKGAITARIGDGWSAEIGVMP